MKKIIQSPTKQYNAYIATDDSGEWKLVVDGVAGEIDSDDFSTKMAIIPFFEIPHDEFSQMIKSEEITTRNFPYSIFLRSAFEHGSNALIPDILNWMENLESINVMEFHNELQKIVENKKYYNQRSRQRALKLLKASTQEF